MEPPNSNKSKYKFVKANQSAAGAFRVDNRNLPQPGTNPSQAEVAIHSSGYFQINHANPIPTNRYIRQSSNTVTNNQYIKPSANPITYNQHIKPSTNPITYNQHIKASANPITYNQYIKPSTNTVTHNTYTKPLANPVTGNQYIRQPVNPVPTNRYIRQQPKANPHLTHQIKTSCDLDELLKRCTSTTSDSNAPPVQPTTTVLNRPLNALNQASSSDTSVSSYATINSQKNLYKLTNKPAKGTGTLHFSQYRTRKPTANSEAATSKPFDFDPKKYKVNNLKTSKKISHKNVFKVVNKRETLSPVKKKTSLEIHQLLALRRSKFLRSQTKLKAQKQSLTTRIVQRYKLIKTNSTTAYSGDSRKRSSFSSSYSATIGLQSNKYKLTNNSRVRSAVLVNKYVNYYSNLSSVNRTTKLSAQNNKNFIANNLLYKSILTINKNDKRLVNVTGAKPSSSKVALSKEKQANGYCKFFNRFGRCARGTHCDKIHDPKRISLCPRFLRGTCNQANCLFSHTISAEKMPLCAYFAKGCCSRESCPYSHVYYGKEAKICLRFAREGFCPLGSNCKLAHINECETFLSTGKCSTGDECPLIHRKRNLINRKPKTSGEAKIRKGMERQKSSNFGDSFIGFHPTEAASDKLDSGAVKSDDVGSEQNKVMTRDDTKAKEFGLNLVVLPTEVQTVQLKTRPHFAK